MNNYFHQLKSTLFTACVFFVIHAARAQNNPGYIGYTKTIDANVGMLMGNLLSAGPAFMPAYGLGFELSTSSNVSFRVGFNRLNSTVSQDNIDRYDTYFTRSASVNPYTSTSEGAVTAHGTFGYRYSSISISPKFFSTSKGAVAPFGGYFGIDLTMGFAKVKNAEDLMFKIIRGGRLEPIDFVDGSWANVQMASIQLNFGKRRFIGTTGISIFYQAGIGYPLWQNSGSPFLDDAQLVAVYNHQDFAETLMIKHIAYGNLLEFKFGMGYALK